jgi:hypothetical protein
MYASGVTAFQKAKVFLKKECVAINQAGATRWLSWRPVFRSIHGVQFYRLPICFCLFQSPYAAAGSADWRIASHFSWGQGR